MKRSKLVSSIFALCACSLAEANSPEQRSREFSQSLTDQSVELAAVVETLLSASPRYSADRNVTERTERDIVGALSSKTPLSHPHLILHKELAADVVKIVVAMDSLKGPIFLKFIYYRVKNSRDDWQLVSAEASDDPESFLR